MTPGVALLALWGVIREHRDLFAADDPIEYPQPALLTASVILPRSFLGGSFGSIRHRYRRATHWEPSGSSANLSRARPSGPEALPPKFLVKACLMTALRQPALE
jgi:hypothetical protein